MADDTNFRSYRPTDQRWPAQSTPPAGGRNANDPLAELARLIGQDDPFADIPPRATPAARPAATQPAPQPAPAFPHDPYGAPISSQPYNAKPFDAGYAQQPQESFQPAYDPALYSTAQPQASDYPSQGYYEDPNRIPQSDDVYAEDYGEEKPPRRGIKLIALVAVLAILGTGVVFGYRALYGGPAAPPPVIKANTAPSKIAPTPSNEANSKVIYDRVGDASQAEKVVPREEKPVEVKDTSRPSPRVVLPGMPTPAAAPDSNSVAMSSPPLSTEPAGPSAAEPKKIRTVTIRPDQPLNTAAVARSSAAAPAPTRTASAAPSAAPREAAPAPAAAPPPPAANAPLSLSPQGANAEASARPAFPPPPTQRAAPVAPTRLAAAPANDGASGSFVQVSSQRSENDAQASFRSLQAKFPNLLGDRQPTIRRADLGDRGIYYRAMVGPFASVEQATQFCGSLKSAGGQCVVQRN